MLPLGRKSKSRCCGLAKLLKKMPSLRRMLQDPEWDQEVWDDAVDIAGRETNVRKLPKVREWDFEQILSADYFPS